MTTLLLLILVVIVGSMIWFFMKGKVTQTHHQVRERAIEGGFTRALTAKPATKYLDQLGRTLTLGTDPHRAGELVAQLASAAARVTDIHAEPGSLVIVVDGNFPRIRAHLLPDRTVIGVEVLSWEMGFPQGAGVWERLSDAIAKAAATQQIPVGEGLRHFAKDATAQAPVETWSVQN
jgi:hypothetical protein